MIPFPFHDLRPRSALICESGGGRLAARSFPGTRGRGAEEARKLPGSHVKEPWNARHSALPTRDENCQLPLAPHTEPDLACVAGWPQVLPTAAVSY